MPLRALTPRFVTLVAFESFSILLAVVLAAWVRLGEGAWTLLDSGLDIFRALLIAVVCQLALYYNDLYELRASTNRREMFASLLDAFTYSSLVLAVLYYWFPSLIIGRGVFAIAVGLIILFVVTWRVAYDWLSAKVGPRERILLLGAGPATVSLAREFYDRRSQLGVEIVGVLDTDPARIGTRTFTGTLVGHIDDIPSIVREKNVDRVVVSVSEARGALPMDRLLKMKLVDGVIFDHLASVYEEYTGKIALENLRPSWFVFSNGFKKSRFQRGVKRAMDVLAAACGLVLASPIMAITTLVIKYTSPGPILYHQRRVGQGGRLFTVHKFRSMRQDAESGTGAVWARANDTRITPIGRFMRKTRIDELPQLWNVLRGEMSFVGPRPERPEFVGDLTQQIPFYGERHVVKPGLTGWAQVRYAYGASVEDAMEKLQYDLFYIKNLSPWLDLFIMFETIKTVILRRGT
jgi:sugar transferase (PEP-CTERM system associated)